MSTAWDFDEHTDPPLGTLRDVASRHRCSIREAREIMGLAPRTMPLGELPEGALFRFNDIEWRKGRATIEHASHGRMIQCRWRHGGAYIKATRGVEPIDPI